MTPIFQTFGEHAILISWEPEISDKILSEVIKMEGFITQTYRDRIIECVPSYSSLAVYLHFEIEAGSFAEEVQKNYKRQATKIYAEARNIFKIPICYKSPYALDLDRVAKNAHISTSEVIQAHVAPIYQVYFIGFLPGFPYLGGLHPKLNTPRLKTPRKRILRGSVGIGGAQTGIYTLSSPGGWNIIGRSPLHFFSTKEHPPSLLQAGDHVKLFPIGKSEFERIEKAIKNDNYTLEKEVRYD